MLRKTGSARLQHLQRYTHALSVCTSLPLPSATICLALCRCDSKCHPTRPDRGAASLGQFACWLHLCACSNLYIFIFLATHTHAQQHTHTHSPCSHMLQHDSDASQNLFVFDKRISLDHLCLIFARNLAS